MADVKIEQTRVALNTSTGTQNITISGFGTPKAAIFIVTHADADDTISAGGAFSIGFTDGASSISVGIHNEDGSASTNTDRWYKNDECVVIPNTTTVEMGASFSSWITDGVQISINSASAVPMMCTVILIGGADVTNVLAFERNLQNSTSPQNFTGVGFEFDAMFMAHIYSNASGNAHSPMGFGCVINDNATTPTQKSVGWCGDNGSSIGDQNTYASDTYALVAPLIGANRWSLTVSDIDADGFTHTNSAATTSSMVCLALEFAAGVEFDLFDVSIPTSGNYAETAPGFQPDFGMLSLIVGPTAYGSLNTGAASGAFAVSTFTDSGIFTNSTSDKDGAPDTICKSLSSDQFRYLDSDGATDAALASGYAFDADGWDFTLSTNPTQATLGWGFAFSAGSGSTPTNYTITGAQTVTASVAAALAFTRNAAIVGALTVSASVAAATEYNQHPAIVGSVGVSATPAAVTEFSSHHAIDGSVSVPVTPAAALDYQRNASIAGALTVSASVAAAMAYNQHPAIVGSVGVSATPAAATEFSSGNSITGDVTVSASVAGVMAFNRNVAIAGDVAVEVTPAASTAYNRHPAIEGALSVGVSASAGMEYASGASIVGSVTATAVPSSAIIFNRHATLAGAVPVAVSPASAMVVNRHPVIDGTASVSVGVAAAMAYAEYVAVTYQDIGLPLLVVNHSTRLKAEHYSILETQHISTRLRVH